MANWYGTSRTNYFKVKDEAAFKKWAEPRGVEVDTDDDDPTKFGLFEKNGEGWPSLALVPSTKPDAEEGDEDEIEVDLVEEIAEHLADGQVAVFMESGAEKLRYVSGFAIAVNSAGEKVSIDLADIYQKAADHFKIPVNEITRAEY